MKFKGFASVLMVVMLHSNMVNAATVICAGKVKALAYHANNQLMIQLESMNTAVMFCSPDSQWTVAGTNYVTGPETCQTMYSTFLAAQMAGKTIKSMHFDGDQVPASCSSWASMAKANIRYYVMDN